MTTLAWKFGSLGLTGLLGTDLTSRVLGFDYNCQLQYAKHNPQTLRVSLDNNDGAFTPDGTGTYNWVATSSSPFCLFAVVDGTTATDQTFVGFITDFDLEDDGVNSSVSIQLTDWFVSVTETPQVVPTTRTNRAASTYLTNALANEYANKWRGSASFDVAFNQMIGSSDPNGNVWIANAPPAMTYSALVNTVVLPAVGAWAWSSQVTGDTIINTGTVNIMSWEHTDPITPPPVLNAVDANNASVSAFRMSSLRRAYNREQMVNSVTVQGLFTGATAQTGFWLASIQLYGTRSLSYTGTGVPSDAVALAVAQQPQRRFAFPELEVRECVITSANISQFMSGTTAATAVKTLLSNRYFLNKMITKFKPKGAAASLTRNAVILGKRIKATPSGTTITLTLANWANYHSWVLDTDILGTDRLG